MKNEVFLILCRSPDSRTIELQNTFSAFGEVYIVADRFAGEVENQRVISIPSNDLEGFDGIMGGGHFPVFTAWTKALKWLEKHLKEFDGIWFVEDDVAGAEPWFRQLIEETFRSEADLFAPIIREKQITSTWSFWKQAEEFFDTPVRSFQPLCRLSQRLCADVLEFRSRHNKFIFHEVLFASLAASKGYIMADWKVHWQFHHLFRNFVFRPEVSEIHPAICHPVKDRAVHRLICEQDQEPEGNARKVAEEFWETIL